MKNRTGILMLFLLISGFTGITQENSITGKWQLVCITDLESAKNSFRPENNNAESLVFNFKDDGKTGKITGKTIRNNVQGDYELFGNNKMNASNFLGTQIAEHGWGKKFLSKIRNASSYTYSSDTLFIYFDSDTKILKFIPIQ